MRYTDNYAFNLPEYSDVIDIENINDNFTVIDNELIALESAFNSAIDNIIASAFVSGGLTTGLQSRSGDEIYTRDSEVILVIRKF